MDNLEIKTERLLLRPLNIKDIETVHAYASDHENTRFMMHLPNETKAETEKFLLGVTDEWAKEEPEFYEFAIVLDGRQIGAISVYLDEQRIKGELGWILNKQYWGKGYATEAASALKDFAVNKLKLQKLVAHCDYRNSASSAVMRKIGLRLEDDTKNRQYRKKQEIAQELMYSLCIYNTQNTDA